ncbi:MAG: penicillin-binding protein 1C [Rhodobacteraceae bacterium]|nr:penicillin-binding protein 1C [Paracoccaceae bacterium]
MIHRLLLALVLVLGAGAGLRDAGQRWIAATQVPAILSQTGTELRDRNGALLRVYPVENGRWRLDLRPDAVDPDFIAALLRYEDKRFLQHRGVDPRAMLRAMAQMLWHGRRVSGGSTLTMQVARLLENSGTGQWRGKLRQIRVALALEQRLEKTDILRLYLLHAPYGGNLEGLRAASLGWFGKPPARLTAAEIAMLVALPQAPEARRPDRHPDAAATARTRVLARLRAAGLIDAETEAEAMAAELPDTMRPFVRLAPHLTDRVVAATPDASRHDLTLDAGLQARIETLARDAVHGGVARLSAAILVADHQSGAILASAGSPDYAPGPRQGFVDMTQALRSPGSTLKPLVYALAFDLGLVHPETLINDGPVQFGRYAPRNFDGVFRGDVPVRLALQQSLNIPVVRLADAIGPARIMDALRRSGAAPALAGRAPGLAVSLGGVGLSLHDLVQLYAALARGGEEIALHHHSAASDKAVAERHRRVVSEVAAWQVGHILAGLPPPPGAPAGALAYKTGTSYGHRDAWAIGWDGRHVIGVWIGRADGTPVPGAFGGDLAAPVLFEAFGRLKPAFDPLAAPPRATLGPGPVTLPARLQRYRPPAAAFEIAGARAPRIVFPPDGARLGAGDGPITVKGRGGQPPYALLANGRVVASGLRGGEWHIPRPGAGFSTLVLLDARGNAARVRVRID